MGELENIKDDFEHLDSSDKRWMVICGVVALAALLFALLIGSVIGDVVAFVLAIAAGWVIRTQWQMVTRERTRRSGGTAAKPRSHARSTRRKTATKTASKSGS